jgi:hypothetical protein
MQMHIPRIRDHAVPGRLLLKIDLRGAGAAGAIIVRRCERICFPEQPRELAEQRGLQVKLSVSGRKRSALADVFVLLPCSHIGFLQRERALREQPC